MLKRCESTNGVVFFVSSLLEQCGVVHAFSTRIGGVSRPPLDSLNLGHDTSGIGLGNGDTDEDLLRNWSLILDAIAARGLKLAKVRQVHGRAVQIVGPGGCDPATPADALMSDQPNQLLTVRTADCVAILVADGARVTGAIHAGWRGVVAGVIGGTIRQMCETFGTSPAALTAAIGPCIGVGHYEVGDEVAAQFAEAGLDAAVGRRSVGKARVDLRAAACAQLQTAGLRPQRIDSTDHCTYRDAAEFYSHRRDGGRGEAVGRMAAMIGWRR